MVQSETTKKSKNGTSANLGFEDKLWSAADKKLF